MNVSVESPLELEQDTIGAKLPSLILAATNGSNIELARLRGWNVLYFYPRTSPPNGVPIDRWDDIPGARGCTPQTCGFRDHFKELKELGAAGVYGVSAQDTAYQTEVVTRLNLPFPLLSDTRLMFHIKLGMPIFIAGGMTLYRRVTLVTHHTEIKKIINPVPDPAANAQDVLNYLGTQRKQ